MSSFVRTKLLLIVACAGLLAGCGAASNGPQRYALSGDVTYQGKPIPVGEISFEPDASKGNDGPGSTARITGGKYEAAGDSGLVGGPYVVWISGFDGVMPAGGDTPDGSPLFADRYQVSVDLPKEDSTRNFDVPAGGK